MEVEHEEEIECPKCGHTWQEVIIVYVEPPDIRSWRD